MRAILGLILCVFVCFAYEIKHENWGKFYKFTGLADEEKFELYLNYFDNEFENFTSEKGFEIPSKIYGHIFFKGEKLEFSKGKINKKGRNITEINALSDWLNLNVKHEKNGKFTGKIAIKGKAYKANINKETAYEILALGLQVINQQNTKFEAVVSDIFPAEMALKQTKKLKEKLANFKQEFQEGGKNAYKNDLQSLEYQNSHIKTTCNILGKEGKICSSTLLKTAKKLSLKDVFVNLDDERLRAIFEAKGINLSEDFSLSLAGISFKNEKAIPIDEIKEFMRESFGLF